MNKRALIITYYWPPSGGSGVQRWVKFVKYLPEYAWDSVVYTPENPTLTFRDESLSADIPPQTEILSTKILEPYGLYASLFGKKGEASVHPIGGQKKSWKQRLSLWVRANCFLPDPKRSWISPSVRFLLKYLKEHPVDVIITTGPPQSMHLIARNLLRALKSKGMECPKWIVDFRDPWTGFYNFKHLNLTYRMMRRHLKLEESVLSEADLIIAVTPSVQKEFQERTSTPVALVTNGFDDTDMSANSVNRFDKFRISYVGIFPADANPIGLWQALAGKKADDPGFAEKLEIRLIGKIDPVVLESIKDCGLTANTVVTGYLPHTEALKEMQQANILLMTLSREPESKKVLAGKIFEYIASRRPVLGICQEDSDSAAILEQCNAGICCEWEDRNKPSSFIDKQWQMFLEKNPGRSDAAIDQFSRKELTHKLVELMNKL